MNRVQLVLVFHEILQDESGDWIYWWCYIRNSLKSILGEKPTISIYISSNRKEIVEKAEGEEEEDSFVSDLYWPYLLNLT